MAWESSAALAAALRAERRRRHSIAGLAGAIALLLATGLVSATAVDPGEQVTVVATSDELPRLMTAEEVKALGGMRSVEVTKQRAVVRTFTHRSVNEWNFEPFRSHWNSANDDGSYAVEGFFDGPTSSQWLSVPEHQRAEADGKTCLRWTHSADDPVPTTTTTAPATPPDPWGLRQARRGPVEDLGDAVVGGRTLRRYRFGAVRTVTESGEQVERRSELDMWVDRDGLVHQVRRRRGDLTSTTTYEYGPLRIELPPEGSCLDTTADEASAILGYTV